MYRKTRSLTGRRYGRREAAQVATALVVTFGIGMAAVPSASAGPAPLPQAPMVPAGPQGQIAVKVVQSVEWLIKEGAKSIVIDKAIEFVVNALPKDGPATLQATLANAPRFSSVSDPQTILWQSAALAGPYNGVIRGDANALFDSMAAAGQRTGSNSLRNGVFTVTLDQGTSSRPPVFTISNAAIRKTVVVLK